MPVMNGYDAAPVIRAGEQRAGQHIPIVALTAHAMKGYRKICLKAGMDDYITKPIHPGELMAAIERWGRPRVMSTHDINTEVDGNLPVGLPGRDFSTTPR